MRSKRIAYGCAAALVCILTAGAASAQDADLQAIVDALFKVGDHSNVRASGAKGICV